jgi:hypothetical protein
MPIANPLKPQEKSLSPGPGFIVAGAMTTNDDFSDPISGKFRSRSNAWGGKGGRK